MNVENFKNNYINDLTEEIVTVENLINLYKKDFYEEKIYFNGRKTNVEILRNIYTNNFYKGHFHIINAMNILEFTIELYDDINDYEIKYYFLSKLNNLNNILCFLKNNNNKKFPFYLKLEYFNKLNLINLNPIDIIFNPKEEFRYFCFRCFDLIKNKELPELKLNLKYETVLIEFRELYNLEFVIKNTILKIGNEWSHTIICGNLNYDYCLKIIGNMNIKIIKLNIDNLNVDNYSKLLCSKEFWNLFIGEKILIYQEDTFIFKSNIMDFIKWDYIGAPWTITDNKDNLLVGNGGLSLRTKKIMLEIIEKIPYLNNIPEDKYFSENINNYGILADFLSGLKFSSECFVNSNSFGSHCIFYYNFKWKSLIYNNLLSLD